MKQMAEAANRLLEACAARKILVATAESCTGGMIVATMTDQPGASSMVDRGFVTYSNEAKMEMLGVSGATLDTFGAVSSETAAEMAAGALERSRAGLTLAVTGIAGPDGGSEEKPVGLVWFGLALTGRSVVTERRLFENRGRSFIRQQTVLHALRMGLQALQPD